jgi:hypothetical protein
MLVKDILFAGSLTALSTAASGVTLQVQSLCSENFTIDTQISATTSDNVGSVTIKGLEAAGVPYIGSDEGISSIGNSPSGDKAMEIISTSHMRAYGWCFSINGIEPAAMPDKVNITGDADIIHWYYGFAEHKDGQWISYCTPTHQAKPAYICAETSDGE